MSNFIPLEVKELIKNEYKSIWLLLSIGSVVSLFIALELICLFFIGKVLLAQPFPDQIDGLYLFDYLKNFSQSKQLVFLGVTFACVIIVRFAFFLLYHHISLKWNATISSRIQNKIMQSILYAPISVYDKTSTFKSSL